MSELFPVSGKNNQAVPWIDLATGILRGPRWLIRCYCRFSRGNVLDGGQNREEVTLAFRFVARNVAITY